MSATTVRPVVATRGVRAAYGPIEVLHGVDLDIAPGAVTAILGPNGAGKTTLLKVIAGLHPVTDGEVLVAGQRVDGARPDALAKVGVCLVPEGRGVFPSLTVRENLRVASHCGRSLADIEAETYERFPRLGERQKQLAGTMSGGEQQMLALARGVAAKPAILLLDELSMGLAPKVVENLYEAVSGIAAEGVAIVVVEQFARVALRVADRAAVMLGGKVVAEGTPSELEGSLAETYLGGSKHG